MSQIPTWLWCKPIVLLIDRRSLRCRICTDVRHKLPVKVRMEDGTFQIRPIDHRLYVDSRNRSTDATDASGVLIVIIGNAAIVGTQRGGCIAHSRRPDILGSSTDDTTTANAGQWDQAEKRFCWMWSHIWRFLRMAGEGRDFLLCRSLLPIMLVFFWL